MKALQDAMLAKANAEHNHYIMLAAEREIQNFVRALLHLSTNRAVCGRRDHHHGLGGWCDETPWVLRAGLA